MTDPVESGPIEISIESCARVGTRAVQQLTRLPRRRFEWFTSPFARYSATESSAGVVLLLFTLLALLISNSSWGDEFRAIWEINVGVVAGSLEFGRSVRDWINDALMTTFFFLVSLELKREFTLGELRQPRVAALSIAAAAGGMLIPACLYLALLSGLPGESGWGTVMATDTAFAIAAMAALGQRIPQSLRVFMLSLAIVDDIGAVLVVAVAYSKEINWGALLLAASSLGVIRGMALLGIRSFAAYTAAGIVVWIALDASGINGTAAGVILGLMTPARRWVDDNRLYAILAQVIAHPDSQAGSGDTVNRDSLRAAEIAARESLSPTERLEIALHPWVAFVVLPLFALANAGVSLHSDVFDLPVMLAIFAGFFLGKPAGIIAFAWLAVRFGAACRPPDLHWDLLVGASMLAGIGFTMALFIAQIAFPADLVDSAKLGILLASVASVIVGVSILAFVTRRRSIPNIRIPLIRRMAHREFRILSTV